VSQIRNPDYSQNYLQTSIESGLSHVFSTNEPFFLEKTADLKNFLIEWQEAINENLKDLKIDIDFKKCFSPVKSDNDAIKNQAI